MLAVVMMLHTATTRYLHHAGLAVALLAALLGMCLPETGSPVVGVEESSEEPGPLADLCESEP